MNTSPASEPGAALAEHQPVLGRQYLTFVVAGETFALAIGCIKELVEYRPPTEVPMMPAFVRGVINLRGHVVPVIDLAARFERPLSGVTRRSCIVIVELVHEDGVHNLGIVVDAVNAVVDIADGQIEPAPAFGARLRPDFIGGMGKVGNGFVIVLAIEKVLAVDELSLLSGRDEGPGRSEPQGAAAPVPASAT